MTYAQASALGYQLYRMDRDLCSYYRRRVARLQAECAMEDTAPSYRQQAQERIAQYISTIQRVESRTEANLHLAEVHIGHCSERDKHEEWMGAKRIKQTLG